MSEQIAVLDGFDTSSISVSPIGPAQDGRIGQLKAGSYPQFSGLEMVPVSPIGPSQDGRIGQVKAQVDQYGRLIMPGVLARNNVIDASAGANYSGGSSYAVGLPLMPSSVGLASLEGKLGRNFKKGLKRFGKASARIATGGMLGAYGYGRAGLGDGYGRAGLGAYGYGRAGLGGCGCPSLDGVPVSPIGSAQDGRIGQVKAQVDQYGRLIMPGVLARTNVVDASAGANYSGGSSYAAGLPLMPSSAGLADADLLDFVNQSGVLPSKQNVIDASGGGNYSGGASYAPGLPLLPSSAGLAGLEGRIGRRIKRKLKKVGQGLKKAVSVVAKIGGKLVPIPGASMAGNLIGGALSDYQYAALAGLAELSVVDGLDGVASVEFKRQLTVDARPLFDATASAAIVAKLKQDAAKANRAKDKAEAARLGRQLAIAREVRRKLVALPPRATVNMVQLDAIIRGVAGGVVGGSPVNQAKVSQLNTLIKNIGAAAARSPV